MVEKERDLKPRTVLQQKTMSVHKVHRRVFLSDYGLNECKVQFFERNTDLINSKNEIASVKSVIILTRMVDHWIKRGEARVVGRYVAGTTWRKMVGKIAK